MPILKITLSELTDTLDELIEEEGEDTTTGICWSCGQLRDCCEPDAEDYECEFCGEHNVQGSLNSAMRIN